LIFQNITKVKIWTDNTKLWKFTSTSCKKLK